MTRKHFNNLLKSTIFVQIYSTSLPLSFLTMFHLNFTLEMSEIVENVDESELPAPMIQIPAAPRLEGLKLIQRYSL